MAIEEIKAEEPTGYREGAYTVGPETDLQEELERAKRGLPSKEEPVYDDHDKLPARPQVPTPKLKPAIPEIKTAAEALAIWGEWCAANNDSPYGAKGLDRPSPKAGFPSDQQAVILVERTHGFVLAYDSLRVIYQGKGKPVRADRVIVERFSRKLQKRLPFRPVPRTEALCVMDEQSANVPRPKRDRLLHGFIHDLRPDGETGI
jgi:hypothetical protein